MVELHVSQKNASQISQKYFFNYICYNIAQILKVNEKFKDLLAII